MAVRLSVAEERFPVAGAFTISRGSRTEIRVVTATLSDGTFVGRGECVPYPRYGETAETALVTGATHLAKPYQQDHLAKVLKAAVD